MVMNASTEPGLKLVAKARATNASASEQIDNTLATGMSASTEAIGREPNAARSARGTNVWVTAVQSPPSATKKKISKNSVLARLRMAAMRWRGAGRLVTSLSGCLG